MLEALLYCAIAALLSPAFTTQELLATISRLVHLMPRSRAPLELGRARAYARRAARIVPGADCVHRAFTARLWLARRGHEARVVVGFRRGERGMEGHAWLELIGGEALFVGEGADYIEVMREPN